MEVKEWGYAEFPEFRAEGIPVISTTGDEVYTRYEADVVYDTRDGKDLHLQILVPKSRNNSAGTYPCVLYVPGSGWFPQHIHVEVPRTARVADLGYVAVVVEYRSSFDASFPAQVIDVKNAVRFMRLHADEYHVDPDRIVLMGSSSGGHTVVFTSLVHEDDSEKIDPSVSAEVNGIIDQFGSVTVMFDDSNPSNTHHLERESPEGWLTKLDLREHPEVQCQISAECNIFEETEMPPMLIIHGTKDRIVNARCSEVLYRRLKETGHDATMYLLQGADHGGPEFWTPYMLKLMDDFMRSCNGLL